VKNNKEQSKVNKMSDQKSQPKRNQRIQPFNTYSYLSLLLRQNGHDMTRAYDCRAKNEHQSMGTIGEQIGTLPGSNRRSPR
jgi:hypothetical protein